MMQENSEPNKPLTDQRLQRKIERLKSESDPAKRKKMHRKLVLDTLSAIAAGTLTQPQESASLVVNIQPETA